MSLSDLDKVYEIMEIATEICTEWECEFLESIRDQLADKRELSSKQKKVLDKLYEKACRDDR